MQTPQAVLRNWTGLTGLSAGWLDTTLVRSFSLLITPGGLS